MYGFLTRTFRIHAATSGRRPMGISRREKRRLKERKLGLELLEDRQMLSAESPLAAIQGAVADDLQLDVQSISSATPEGQAAILQNELFWQSLIAANSGNNALAARSIPTDPLLPAQWHLINSGQQVGNPDFQPIFAIPNEDINVAPVWNQGLTGKGVTVAVIDSGVQTDHPDLADNISDTLRLNASTGNTGGNNGDPLTLDDAHGTSVAGLIGAIADNGIGGTGVAPGVEIAPIQFLGGPQTNLSAINAFRFATDQIDITNNSWGPAVARGIAGPTPDELLALRDSVIFGRDGLGVVHLFASGNDAGSGFNEGFQNQGFLDSATYDGWVGSRYTIGVTGVDHDGFYNNTDGTITSYPEAGADVLIAAPTGSTALDIGNDTGIGSGIVTTDTTGDFGFNGEGVDSVFDPLHNRFDRDFLPDTNYTSRFNGTSAATPIATGVVALMLEANPNLSWRDVQEILVRSARQNAEFDIPTSFGVPSASLGTTQNTWITNQMPVFHDPDIFDPTVDPLTQTLDPTLDPNLGRSHYAPTPITLTNSAGYTVSQGRGVYGEEIGYAHGVVDAELAVQLAQQWDIKNQTLPGELTFTSNVTPNGPFFFNLPAAEQGDQSTGFQLVPGGLFGLPGFIDYWQEYFADDPFSSSPPPANTRGGAVTVTVPASNNMDAETVEVKLSISGGTVDALDSLRILLVSPDGTQSELNDFFIDDSFRLPHTLQNESPATFFTGGPTDLSVDTNPGGNLVATFTTNRSWGERSDDSILFDPTTAEPVIDFSGAAITQGWTLQLENYSPTSFQVEGLEFIWHGSPIGADTQRVQGLIGVDDNRDDQFNFSRVFLNNSDTDGVVRFSEVSNTIDTSHESMGANVTVTATRTSDNVVVDQFVTGADGNFYFDLVPDDYMISVDDPLSRTAVDDSTTPAGFLQDYKSEWHITPDFFKVWDYDANLEVPVDGTGTPSAWLDGNGQEVTYGMKHINFLLDPGPPPVAQVEFSGTVFADTNGDGQFNPDDVAVPQISVFADQNRNGQFDAGEIVVSTDASGQYNLVVPSTFTTVMNVGVIAPVDWTPTSPDSGISSFFVQPGDTFSDVDFALMPPSVSAGDGSDMPGFLLGTVFNDVNADGRRQESEAGVSGLRVFIDANNTGVIDAGDTVTTTNVHGGFVFANVPAGDQIVRLEALPPNEQTLPFAGGPLLETLSGAGTISNLLFGVRNSSVIVVQPSTLDFGDLPDRYGVTTLFQDGARHVVGPFFLGQLIDTEEDGQPSPDATLDDTTNLADEDGIVFDPIQAGGSGRLMVTASLYGGYLAGWMDFNGDGDFNDTIDGVSERLVLTKAGGGVPETRTLLEEGTTEINFDLPATIDATTVFARFRYGEKEGVDTLTGMALIGEVEDYALPVLAPLPLVANTGPDLDADGDVDGFDFLTWQRGFGITAGASPSQGDVNGDGAVAGDDLAEIQTDFGASTSETANLTVGAGTPAGDFNTDGNTDGADFLAWQRGAGTAAGATLAEGDANGDGAVDGGDLAAWQNALAAENAQQTQTSSVAFATYVESQPENIAPYSIAALLGSQQTAATASSVSDVAADSASLSFNPQGVPAENTLAENAGETFAGNYPESYPGNIRIIHHGRDDRFSAGVFHALRGLTAQGNLLSTAVDRANSPPASAPGLRTHAIRSRWDRSMGTDLSGGQITGHPGETPTRDRALLDLYGADRRRGRTDDERGSHLQWLSAEHDPATAAMQHEALLAALSEKWDWLR